MRNATTSFRDFYTWFFKDWMLSGARTRLTLPQRAIYLDLLGFSYCEGGISSNVPELLARLGLGKEHTADVETVLKEFELGPDDSDYKGRLIHPRMLVETKRLEDARERKRLVSCPRNT